MKYLIFLSQQIENKSAKITSYILTSYNLHLIYLHLIFTSIKLHLINSINQFLWLLHKYATLI